ncbi:MAG: hypothetical protein K5696_13100 [Lachnospiraceae bacterium]|nr:hypothetical protein [Lachnospiraceae bacterium]
MKRKALISATVLAAALALTSCSSKDVQADSKADVQVEVQGDSKTDEKADVQADAQAGPEAQTADAQADPEVQTAQEASVEAAPDIDYPTLPLPEFHYYGPEDWADYGDVISQYLISRHLGDEHAAGDLATCTPIILKVDESDPKDVKVWGDYQLNSYLLMKTSLLNESGGSYPAVVHLDTTDTPVVTGVDYVEDGSSFDPSFDRLFGEAGLKEAYQKENEKRVEHIIDALSYYINHNGLYITQMQDYGWPPYPIPNAPETRDEDQIIDYTGNSGYRTKYDMRQICALEMSDMEMFSSVGSDEWNNFIIEIRRIDGKDIDGAIKEIRSYLYDPEVELKREDNVSFVGKEGCTRLSNEPPYKDGDKVYTIYIVPREGDLFVTEISSDYSTDEQKQMLTDDIISAFLGSMEVY